MNVQIKTIPEFNRQYKRLKKKFHSLPNDIKALCEELSQNPMLGTPLGFGGAHKVRMAIVSKGGGKSGGARVITFSVKISEPDNYIVSLLTIYDKGEMENVSEQYIEYLVKKK